MNENENENDKNNHNGTNDLGNRAASFSCREFVGLKEFFEKGKKGKQSGGI